MKNGGSEVPLGREIAAGAGQAHGLCLADIEAVAFDRSGFRFHGRVKALAEAARAGGLKF